ncbi:MAG: integration host factor subunit beta [Myxococcota bacterium]
MTKSELIRAVAEKMPNLPARDLEIVVNTIFDTMTQALRIGDRIEIRGFGSFTVRQRRARTGRNPKTGETIEVPAKRVPFFTVGHELKKRVDDGRERYPLVEDSASEQDEDDEPVASRTSPSGGEALHAQGETMKF